MGGAKAWMMEQEERGYWALEGNICSECVIDKTLQEFIKDNAVAKQCDFCEKKSKKEIAASFDDVAELIVRGIYFEWNSPDSEGVSYESAEGGYLATLTDTHDLIYDTYEISENDAVREALLESIMNQQWVEKDFYIGSEGQRFQWGWDAFRHEVTHKKRFVFLHSQNQDRDPGEIKPSDFLFEMADFKNRKLDNVSLIREIEPGTDIYRIRVGKNKFKKAETLGAPPLEYAIRSNRMSPAGIPMFYGAFDKETAIQETYEPDLKNEKQFISIGHFQPIRKLLFLDLATLPDIPSVFNLDQQHMIHALRFFHGFAKDISKPVSRNGKEHVEYVPTQVVTEFFRHIYQTGDGKRLDGIIYRSSREGGRIACVIFCENEQACDSESSKKDGCFLELVKTSYRKV